MKVDLCIRHWRCYIQIIQYEENIGWKDEEGSLLGNIREARPMRQYAAPGGAPPVFYGVRGVWNAILQSSTGWLSSLPIAPVRKADSCAIA